MFALELDHRAKDGKAGLASHPGAASSSLLTGKERDWGRRPRLSESSWPASRHWPGSRPGAARTPLYAATEAGLTDGEYIGPGGRAHLRGRRRK